MRNFLLLSALCTVLLTGCSKSSDDVGPLNPPTPPTIEHSKIPINITAGVWTRVTDNTFENGDKTGVYVVNYDGTTAGFHSATGNYVNNMRFTYSGSWSPDTQIYWKDKTTKADFYCYFPYASNITDISAYPFSVKADQSNEANYKASEFLWGKTAGIAPTSNPVQITVKHIMSNLLIYLKAGNGYKAEDLKHAKITVCGLKTNSTINLATGKVTATGTATDMVPKAETDHYRVLVVPQNVSSANLIKVSIDGNEYTLNQTISFESNKQHTCTLTINKTSEGINIGISGWETDKNDYGGTVN